MKLFFYCAVALLVSVPEASGIVAPSPAEKLIFDQINQERMKTGASILDWNDNAAQAARVHAGLLAENERLSHQFAGEAGVAERLGAAGARFTVAGENVARTGFVEDVHPALMTSPGHRGNILTPKYNAVGIGVVEREGKIYVAQDFVFAIPEYSEVQFAQAFADAFNAARRAKGARHPEAHADPALHEAACSTNGDAKRLADKVSGASSIVVFTSSIPHQLPEELMLRAAKQDFYRMNFSVCFRPEQEHGYANFWVVVTFSK